MKLPRFALVGCGRIGKRHAEHINNFASLAAVCDIDQNKAKAFAEQYKVPYYRSIEELLRKDPDIDVVSICTPNGFHAKQTIVALRHGKHVLCEKPMALSVQDAWAMITEAEKAERRLFIVKQNRFNPPVEKVKQLIDEGLLGRIYSAQVNCFWNRNDRYYSDSDWKGLKTLDGGILFTQFSHFIDLIYWFLGDLRQVTAFSRKFRDTELFEFEDTLVANLEFSSGALATLNCTINSHEKNMEGSITIFAENGTVKIGGQYLNVLEYQNVKDHIIENVNTFRPANDYGYYQGSMSNHDHVIKNVVDVLCYDGQIATTGYEGMKTVEIVEKIYASITQKTSIIVDNHDFTIPKIAAY